MSNIHNGEYVLPTPLARRARLPLLAIGIGSLFLIEPVISWYTQALDQVEDIERVKAMLKGFGVIWFLMFFSFSAWSAIIGYRAFAEKRWPPQDFPVLFRTKIRYGKLAILDGIGCLAGAFFLGVGSVFWGYFVWLACKL